MKKAEVRIVYILSFAFCLSPTLMTLSGCGRVPKAEAEAQTRGSRGEREASATPVDVAIARTGVLVESPTYIGTTQAAGEVSLRSRVEGRLLNLSVNIGDRVARGQVVAELDNTLLLTAVAQAQAELASRESEVARAKTQINNAKARAEEARVQLKQAQNNAARRQFLQKQGAISLQDAELAQTEARTQEQVLRAASEQIRTEEQAVAAAQGRVKAQRAVIAELRERLSYARVTSPIDGVVIERVSEPGNLVQPGGEILKLGDFSSVKVVVDLSELKLPNVRVGQSVQVRLDAFGNQTFSGRVARISPAADAARRIPVEIVIPNSEGRIGSGLFARVTFSQQTTPKVLVPQSALQAAGRGRGAGEQGSRGAGEQGSRGAEVQGSRGAEVQGSRGAGEQGSRGDSPSPVGIASRPSSSQSPVVGAGLPRPNQSLEQGTVFVVSGEGNEAKVSARQVQLGDRANAKVEILSGLQAGERFVVRSGKPLKDGDAVRFSILSEGVQRSESKEGEGSTQRRQQ